MAGDVVAVRFGDHTLPSGPAAMPWSCR